MTGEDGPPIPPPDDARGGGAYLAAERRLLEAALQAGDALRCPRCDAELTAQAVEPAPGVAYVRRRVLVVCPQCRRAAGLDVRR